MEVLTRLRLLSGGEKTLNELNKIKFYQVLKLFQRHIATSASAMSVLCFVKVFCFSDFNRARFIFLMCFCQMAGSTWTTWMNKCAVQVSVSAICALDVMENKKIIKSIWI